MGRRALPKIDSNLDLSRYCWALDRLTTPLRTADLFESEGPLVVEVGSGKGLFLETASGLLPQKNFLGCEVSHKYARYAATQLARTGRTNASVIDGDAMRLFCDYLSDECAESIHVYFPDPWWKRRHRKRRVMNHRFLRQAQRVLQPGGQLHFWTDVQEYFREGLRCIAAATTLEGPFDEAEAAAVHELGYRTHYERRTRRHDEPVYRVWYAAPSRQGSN